ncbi:MAG TPA: hypothetical protein VD903_00350 [Pseudonocardia sp.]|nr:hypothetical protein [Pseudonocardia sp.]
MAHSCVNMLSYGMMTWMPSYLSEVRALSLVAAGFASAGAPADQPMAFGGLAPRSVEVSS